jgi:RNA polymerase sigma-70 factor (ECF subfamily)
MSACEQQLASARTFEALYRKYVPSVLRFALRHVSTRDLAEDLTAETFLALYLNLDQIDASQLPCWLFTVLRNRARDHWRRRMIEQRFLETLVEPVAQPSRCERWVIESPHLKPVHRMCLKLHYIYGMTRREIASQTGLGETQVKGYLQYAVQLLRKTHALPTVGVVETAECREPSRSPVFRRRAAGTGRAVSAQPPVIRQL